MLPPPRYFIGKLADGSERWAAVDGNARYLKGAVAERRFGAYMSPFPDEQDARQALLEAGVDPASIAAEQGRRGKRGAQ